MNGEGSKWQLNICQSGNNPTSLIQAFVTYELVTPERLLGSWVDNFYQNLILFKGIINQLVRGTLLLLGF